MPDEYGYYGYDNQIEPQPQRKSKSGTMAGLVLMAVGVMSLILSFVLIPYVGAELEDATKNMIPASGDGSQWNSSVNADLPTASGFWSSIGGIMKVAGVIIVIAGVLTCFRPG